jgi:hypothetical protein
LSSEDANRIAEQAAQWLARDSRVLLVYLFGSVADRGRTAVRDIGLAILTRGALPPHELLRMRADLVSRTTWCRTVSSDLRRTYVLRARPSPSGHRCNRADSAGTNAAVEKTTQSRFLS